MNNKLFEQMNFVGEYKDEMFEFYRKGFENEEKEAEFFIKVLQCYQKKQAPFLMMNRVKNLVSVANDIDKIYPCRDPLKIVFIKSCMEGLCSLSDYKKSKKTAFFNEFAECFSEKGKKYISDNFSLFHYKETEEYGKVQYKDKMTVNAFLDILKFVRDEVVHDGKYWTVTIFKPSKAKYEYISGILKGDKELFKNQPHLKEADKCEDLHIETGLDYDKFIAYFIEACANFILHYISKIDFNNK